MNTESYGRFESDDKYRLAKKAKKILIAPQEFFFPTPCKTLEAQRLIL